MFRSPNDVTSSDPESSSDEGNEESLDVGQSWAMGEGEAGEHSSHIYDESASPRGQHDQTSVPNLDPNGHSNFILSSLLEHYCRDQATKAVASGRSDGTQLEPDDPEVQSLSRAMYARLSGQLHDYGIVGHGYDSTEYEGVRNGYLQGLDYMLHNAVQDSPIQPGPASTDLSIRPHRGIGTPLRGNSPRSSARQLLPARSEDPAKSPSIDSQIRGLQLGTHPLPAARASSGIPLELRPSNETFLPTSRYSTDFAEIGVLGKGGYGKVYQAVNHLDGQHYAIKKITLSPKRLKKLQEGGNSEMETLLREIRTLARLDHANVVRYFNGWIERSGGTNMFRRDRVNSSRLLTGRPSVIREMSGSEEAMPKLDEGDDGGVLFENSSNRDDGEHTEPESKRGRSASHTTTSSTVTKRSTAHSVEEDEEDVEHIPRDFGHITSGPTSTGNLSEDLVSDADFVDLVRGQNGASSGQPTLVLHIQMSLHPTSLSTYLFTDRTNKASEGDPDQSHCFHLKPSLSLTLAILAGVEYLHSQGVVHRDLKPGNVFLALHRGHPPTTDCVNITRCPECPKKETEPVFVVPRIGDFGLVAEIARPEDCPIETRDESKSTGEPITNLNTDFKDFASPREQAPRPVGTEFYRPATAPTCTDERLDVFSLGIITFEMLWPFQTKMERHETLSALNKGQLPTDFGAKIGDITGRVTDCVIGMVCPNVEKRWSCKEVRACLEGIVNNISDA
ncbi:MAG: hypothetical protein M4579_003567 [Chaenotheca gracillima]|nr:MAG: hypothetical protein M4579_003567 [Chaenotheca gracillima]